jgi:hypothetical protein
LICGVAIFIFLEVAYFDFVVLAVSANKYYENSSGVEKYSCNQSIVIALDVKNVKVITY